MNPMGEIQFRVFQEPSRFGHSVQIYIEQADGKRAFATDMQMEDYEPGQKMPDAAVFPIASSSLEALGKYLIGQGLITAPVTDRERNEHEKLKIKHEILVEQLAETKEQLDKQTKILGEISGVANLAKDMIDKMEGK